MDTYLFDTNAIIHFYSGENPEWQRRIGFLVAKRSESQNSALLLIPTFCIVETFAILARMHFKDGKLDRVQYKKCRDKFRNDLHWAKVFYPYETSRYHIVAVDEVIALDEITRQLVCERGPDKSLSAVDLLLVAMASELTYMHSTSTSHVMLVTCDKHMKEVCNIFRTGHRRRREEFRGDPFFPDIPPGRWPPPEVLYVPDWKLPPDAAKAT